MKHLITSRVNLGRHRQDGEARPRLLVPVTSLLLSLVILCGCSSFTKNFDLSKRIPWMDTDSIVDNPQRVTVLWTHTILNQQGLRGVRGFGGRLMFHANPNEKPVRVEGTLTVYAFDETKQTATVPERKFLFTPEQFENHYSKTKLGHSYSIWVPWDEVGGEPRRINLLVRFEPKNGSMIMSENSLQVLPGIEAETDKYDESAPSSEEDPLAGEIQQAGFQQSSRSKALQAPAKITPLREAIESDTINLPLNFARRLNQLSPEDMNAIDEKNKADEAAQKKPTNPESVFDEEPADDAAVSVNLQRSITERQKELASRFARRKFQAQKGQDSQSRNAPQQTKPSLEAALSDPPPSMSLAPKDRAAATNSSSAGSSSR